MVAMVIPHEPQDDNTPHHPVPDLTVDENAFIDSLPRRLRMVSARRELTRESLPDRGESTDDPVLSAAVQEVWDCELSLSRSEAHRYRALAALHTHDAYIEADGTPGPDDHLRSDLDATRAALALRVPYGTAAWQLRDAHIAVTSFPRTLAQLEAGSFGSWQFRTMLRKSRHLTEGSRSLVDATVAAWSRHVTAERFTTLLNALIRLLEDREKLEQDAPVPEPERSIELATDPHDGTGALIMRGPIPEILATWKQIDESAHAIQAAQRKALAEKTTIPHDPDGVVAATGRTAGLKLLRYRLMATAVPDTAGVSVPAERFRLNITVPALTLLGVTDTPGMLEGTIPIPVSMARTIAGACERWYRVLTDPATGAFLPLPAGKYQPTQAMLEHLRLRHPYCAVPGCTRPTSWASECDHIDECLRNTPDAGGPTDIENIHLLCWQHHLAKTRGLLDPIRRITAPAAPGATRWKIGAGADQITVGDDTDPLHHLTMTALERSWKRYLALQNAPPPKTAEDEPAGGVTSSSAPSPSWDIQDPPPF